MSLCCCMSLWTQLNLENDTRVFCVSGFVYSLIKIGLTIHFLNQVALISSREIKCIGSRDFSEPGLLMPCSECRARRERVFSIISSMYLEHRMKTFKNLLFSRIWHNQDIVYNTWEMGLKHESSLLRMSYPKSCHFLLKVIH